MKKLLLTLFTLLFLQTSNAQEVVSSTFLTSYSQQYLVNEFEATFAQYGVDLYRVTYTTTNLEGALDTASGLVCIPDIEGLNLPLVSYGHGTVASRFAVPSFLSSEHVIPTIYASVGVVSVAPDYLGLGVNEGIHPYVHADSEAWASYDLIVAIKPFLEDEFGLGLNEQLYITGYSQGGHAAMALHRYIETETDLEVTGSVPMSGPYSISTGMKDLLVSQEEYLYVAYLASTAISYQEVYGDIYPNGDINQFFKPIYATQIERFRKEEIDLFILNQLLINALIVNEGGSIPNKMIQDEVLADILEDDNHPVNVALRDNDVYDWAPKAETRLLYCEADDQVAYENSIIARDKMIENGADQVLALDLGSDLDHGECVTPAIISFSLYLLVSIMPTHTLDLSTVEVNIFPNPTSEGFHIVTKDRNESFSISLFDYSGRLVLQRDRLQSGDYIRTDLDAGIYVLSLQDPSGVTLGHQRLIIK